MSDVHPFLKPAVAEVTGGKPGINLAALLDMLNTMRMDLDTAAGTIADLRTALAGKASAAGLSTLSQRVGAAENTLATKATTDYVDGQLHAVANVDADQASAIRLVQQALGSDRTVLQTLLANQTTQADLLTGLRTDVDTKAQAATVSSLSGQVTTLRNTVNDANNGLAATNTLATTANTEVAKRLLRSGDTATGPLMVPNATLAAAAPRLDQTYGGLNAPIRFATAVGATPTAMLPGPLTDPTPQGRKAKPYFVVLTMRTAPTIGATITVGTSPGGAEVFTKTYTLALLPGLNAVLAPMQPIFIELPAGTTLYAKATAGTWDVEVLSYYKS
jgi:hypothetical protein